MKTLYFDCSMGAAGDMFMAALLELHPNPDRMLFDINNLGIPGAHVAREHIVRHGTKGTHMKVLWNGLEEKSYDTHTGRPNGCMVERPENKSPLDVMALLESLPIKRQVMEHAKSVLQLIFEAESHAHGGIPIADIHQSRLGTMDAVIDVVGSCMLMDELLPERIFASPIHVGSGKIYCRGGELPVPAPATAYILRGIPCYGGAVQGELCTPTGAALLRHFVTAFIEALGLHVAASGCGIGSKDFGLPGGLMVAFGEYVEASISA